MNYYGTKLKVYKIHQKREFNALKLLKKPFSSIKQKYRSFNYKKRLNFKFESGIKKSKNSLLIFIRYFYDANFKYIDKLIEKWIKTSLQFFVNIFVNGFVLFLVLIAITSMFPSSSHYISLGPGLWYILNILNLGLILWFIEKGYRWFRIDYKGGMKIWKPEKVLR